MIGDYIRLSLQNVRHRGVRSWLTMLGIFIGIASVVALISLGSGLREAVTGQFASLEADKLIIQNIGTGFGPPGSTAVRKLTSHDLDLIKEVHGVELVVPRLIRVVKVEFNKVTIFNGASSLPEDDDEIESVYDTFNFEVESGRLLEAGERGKIIVGNGFAEKDDFGKPIRVGTKINIQGKEFEIVGILKKSGSIFINEDVMIPEKDLREILGLDDEIDMIEVNVENVDDVEKVSEDIERKLRKDRKLKEGEEDFSVQTPLQSVEAINTVLDIINIIVAGIAAISLLVGGVGIMNTMYTSVLERTREIGIMKAVGARNRDVLIIFIIESGLLGLVGGLIGAAIGLGLSYLVSASLGSFLGGVGIETQFSLPLILGAVSFSLIVGIASGIVPAYQASRLNTVEALRS